MLGTPLPRLCGGGAKLRASRVQHQVSRAYVVLSQGIPRCRAQQDMQTESRSPVPSRIEEMESTAEAGFGIGSRTVEGDWSWDAAEGDPSLGAHTSRVEVPTSWLCKHIRKPTSWQGLP